MTTASNSRVLRTIPLLIAVCFVSLPAYAQYSGGTGEPNNPYQIATVEDLIWLGRTPGEYDKHFILTGDIDLDPNLPGGRVFDRAVIAPDINTSIKYQGTAFAGTFNGNGFVLSNLRIIGDDFLGLFGQIDSGAKVFDLGIVDASIVGTGEGIGGLVGSNTGDSITTCYTTGTVSGERWIGGLIGYNMGPVANCYSDCTVSGEGYNIGGLIGRNRATVSNCYSTGTVSGRYNQTDGFVGMNTGTVTNCFWDTETSGQNQSAGGIGKTTAEMQTISTFSEWDFNTIWVICEGFDYPKLQRNDDYVSLFEISRESFTVPEGGMATVSIALRNDPLVRTEVTVSWQSGDSDIAVSSGEFMVFDSNTFAEPQMITLWAAEDDDFLDGTAQFSIVTQGSAGLLECACAMFTVTERDNEKPGFVASGDLDTIAEGSTGTLSVALPRDPVGTLVVSVSKLAGDPDITMTSGTSLVFNSSNYSVPQRVTLAAAEDADNLNGSVLLSITAPGYMTTELSITEHDNDELPSFVITGSPTQIVEGSTGTFTVALPQDPFTTVQVTVVVASGDSDITIESDTSLTFDSSNYAEPQTVRLSAAEDDDALNGTALIQITSPGFYASSVGADEMDNEQPDFVMSGDLERIAEGSTGIFSVALPRNPLGILTVRVYKLEGDPDIAVISGTSLIFDSSNYSVPQAVTLEAAEDADNLNGSAAFAVTAPGYMRTELSMTELDNDELPGFVITGSPLTIIEGSTGAFSVALPQDPFVTVEVTVLVESGDPDITIESGTSLTFDSANYAKPQTVLIAAAEDEDCIPGTASIRIEAPGFAPKVITVTEQDKDCGTGMPGAPFLIYTAEQMNAIGANPDNWDKHFKLIVDIDLSHYEGTDFNIIGYRNNNDSRPFTGVFDGNGHTIASFSYRSLSTDKYEYIGLFGYVDDEHAVIKDLGLIDPNVNGGTGNGVGALVGYLDEGTVNACYVEGGRVMGNDQVGGLVSFNRRGTIIHCYSQTAVSGTSKVGGLVGQNDEHISACYSAGRVLGNANTGGLAGSNRGDIINCFWDKNTSGQTHSSGGTGKTTMEMKTPDTFGPWFVCAGQSVWTMDAGNDYPRLWWEGTPGQPLLAQRLADFLSGAGTVERPYLIYTSHDINRIGMSSCDRDKHFKLMADVDLSGLIWDAAIFPTFSKTFNGNSHVIRNLTITGQGDHAGLFGRIQEEAQVYDLGIVDAKIAVQGNYVGILAGENTGSVTRCFSGGTVSGHSNVGGLLGIYYNYDNSRVSHCYSTAVVSGTERIGGLIGHCDGSVNMCYSTGAVSGSNSVGGLVGSGYRFNLVNGVWDINTSDQTQSASGVGLTTIEMKTPEMLGLNGWALDPNWVMNDSNDYPRLAWQGTVGQVIPEPIIDWLDGSGTLDDPYQIMNLDQFSLVGKASTLWDRHFALKHDIDLGGQSWTGAVIPAFAGIFNGNGHIISNLTITGEGDYLGLFGRIESEAVVFDLGVVNARIHGTADNYGILAGYNYGSLSNCFSTGSVRGTRNLGGLVGENAGNMTHCYSTGTITGSENSRDIGGLVGSNTGTLMYCYSTCAVSGNERVGGLVGQNSRTVTQCYSTGAVTGNEFAGGLVGRNDDDVINCVWDMDTSGQKQSGGGIGLTTAQMMDPEMLGLNGWALDPNWVLDAGHDYVHLVGEGTPGVPIPEPTVDWLAGMGSEERPYTIATADQLITISRASTLWDKHFELSANIYLSGMTWSSAVFQTFSGTLNGNGFVIFNLSITGEDHLGFFGILQEDAQVLDLGIVDVSVTGTKESAGEYIGILAGENHGNVTHCYSHGSVGASGRRCGYIGGLVGRNSGTMINCHSAGTVTAGEDISDVGGLVGDNGGTMINCHSSGTVTAGEDASDVGGLVGRNRNSGTMINCHSTGTVTAGEDASDVGGLVGDNGGSIANCYSTSRVVAGMDASDIGGLVGVNSGSVTSCYSMGSVSGDDRIGGLVGDNRGGVTTCYSTGVVLGIGYTGGLIGSYRGTVIHCVWDMETSGQVQSGGGVGLITPQMMDPDMLGLNGWALDPNWVLDPGKDYPRLAWEGTPGQLIPEPLIDWLDGSGTLADPYQVMNADQLVFIGKASVLWNKNFILMQDIDLIDIALSMSVIPEFSGIFNGNGRIIRNMQITGPGSYLGLFGRIQSEATVLDIGIANANIVTTGSDVGGLAGNNMGTITRCFSTVNISGENSVGGLLGSNNGNVINCYSSGTVSGNDFVGGLLGSSSGNLSRCYSTNAVSGGDRDVGGLVGSSDDRAFDCLWDIETSGQIQSAIGIGLETSQMMDPDMYAFNGWALDPNWVLDSGNDTPRLEWEGMPGDLIPESTIDWLIGMGTPSEPYELFNVDQLILMSRVSILWDKHFVLGTDIDLAGTTWAMPVIPEFSGTFSGNNHVFRHLSMTGVRDNLGFFGVITSSAVIFDLSIIDSDVTSTGDYIGILVGQNDGVVIRCNSSGTVAGGQACAGGLIGSNSGEVINCNNEAAVSGEREVGGLAGRNSGHIAGSQNGGSVHGESFIGGLVGSNPGNIINSSNSGAVSGDGSVGGLVGSTGSTGGGRRRWGFSPSVSSMVMNCYSTGPVTGNGSLGGFIGYCGGSVANCFATGNVSCNGERDIYVGGFAGQNGGNLANCYSTGSISYDRQYDPYNEDPGRDIYLGGLVGQNEIRFPHAASLYGIAVNCFWDVEASGFFESAGGEGLATVQMQDTQTFMERSWDFVGTAHNGLHETWQMPAGGGYPDLSIFHGYEPPMLPGQGTSQDPYRVSTTSELGAVLHHDPYAYYQLNADLDLSGITWSMAVIPWLAGTFDGSGFEIRGLTISGGDNLGLFGTIGLSAEVYNLGIVDADVAGDTHVGVLAGLNDHGIVSNCYSTGNISGSVSTGGLIGYTNGGIVSDCYSTATVSGGLNSGGLVGYILDGDVVGCYSTGSVSGQNYVGGLVGDNSGNVGNCYSSSTASGNNEVGGLAGVNSRSISRCYSIGIVSGNDYVGGLTGQNRDNVDNCYSMSTVSGNSNIGGLVGNNNGIASNCYSTGTVSGNANVGGLVGFNNDQITDCFWDVETSGLSISSGGDGLHTATMQNMLVYLDYGWDFVGKTENGTEDIWFIDGRDYPRLSWEYEE